MAEKAKVCVVGSVNMDLVTATNVVPKQGETLLGDSFFTNPGGKGANQAIAASRMGANVEIIGAVGGDDFGFAVKENLTINGVGTSSLTTLKNESTGIANIILSESDNRIIVVQGANKALNKQMIQEYQSKIIESDIILMQLEIPMPTILATLQI